MKNIFECPVCDSKNIEIIDKTKEIFVPMAKTAIQNVRVCHCNECGARTRVDSDSQKDVLERIKKKGDESMPALIETINKAGYTDTRLERAFSLPAHTINRWKQGEKISASVLALTRLVASQPKLIDFAEEGFADSGLRIEVKECFEDTSVPDEKFSSIGCMYTSTELIFSYVENLKRRKDDIYSESYNEGMLSLCN